MIAVGSGNWQSSGRPIRVQTFAAHNRPELGDGRVPHFADDEPDPSAIKVGQDEGVDGNLVDAKVTIIDESAVAPMGTGLAAPRRNTLSRKHSPSVTSAERPPLPVLPAPEHGPDLVALEKRLQELTNEHEALDNEIMRDLESSAEATRRGDEEKQLLRAQVREKEEASEKLKREATVAERAMRAAQARRTALEKSAKDERAAQAKFLDQIRSRDEDIEVMERSRRVMAEECAEFDQEMDSKSSEAGALIALRQDECAGLEVLLREKRLAIDEDKKTVPENTEDGDKAFEEHRATWARREREYRAALIRESRRTQHLDNVYQHASAALQNAQQSGAFTQVPGQSLDYENGMAQHMKRHSRANHSLGALSVGSSLPPSHPAEPIPVSSAAFPHAGTVQAPSSSAFGMTDMLLPMVPYDAEEAGRSSLTGGAPLSPNAGASFLPTGLWDEVNDPGEPPSPSSFGPPLAATATLDIDPQSPASSGRSISLLSSPRSSNPNLPFSQYAVDQSDRNSLHAVRSRMLDSPSVPSAQNGNRFKLFSANSWNKDTKDTDDFGPMLGTLKAGQSQSFPRQAEDAEASSTKKRLRFSAGFGMFNRHSGAPEPARGESSTSGSDGVSAATRRLFPWGHSSGGGNSVYRAPDPNKSRPPSMGSSEFLARPSTDSGPIWGPIGSSVQGPYFANDAWTSSRNASRRPSFHGDASHLRTNLANPEDEILDDEALQQAPATQVGVIGSRPRPAAKQASLSNISFDPTAPSFITRVFKGGKSDKGKGKTTGGDAQRPSSAATSDGNAYSFDDSPSDPRKSRDELSVRTGTSVSESRESLSLDRSASNAGSEDPASLALAPASSVPASLASSDNVVRKLFRKGSSSKFSFTGRLGVGTSSNAGSVTSGTSGGGAGGFKKSPGFPPQGFGTLPLSSGASGTGSERGGASERHSLGGDTEDDDFGGATGSVVGAKDVTKSTDSITSSPNLGARGKDGKSGWGRFSMKKKGKERDGERESVVD